MRYVPSTMTYLHYLTSYPAQGHCFCTACISEIKQKSPRCPQCRDPIKAQDGKHIHITLVPSPTNHDNDDEIPDSELPINVLNLARNITDSLGEDVDTEMGTGDSSLTHTRARVSSARDDLQRLANGVRKHHGSGSTLVRLPIPILLIHFITASIGRTASSIQSPTSPVVSSPP
jgi:hypothetical protein